MNNLKPKEFSKTVIEFVIKNKYSYMEAIAEACSVRGIEYEKVKPLLTPVVLEHLTAEVQAEHLIPQTAKLDI